RRKHWRRHLAPLARALATPQLGAEMAEVERGIDPVALRQHRRHGIAQELDIDDLPSTLPARQFDQPLAGSDVKPIRHGCPRLASNSVRSEHRAAFISRQQALDSRRASYR